MFHSILNLFGLNRASKKSKRSKLSGFGGPRRLRLEPLEDRRMLATLTVNASFVQQDGVIASFDQDGVIDDGTLTLREAIAYVNNDEQPLALDLAQIDDLNGTEPLGTNDIILFDSILSGATIKLGIDSSDNVITSLTGYIGALSITNPTYSDGDINGDGVIDDADLDLAFAQFGLAINSVA